MAKIGDIFVIGSVIFVLEFVEKLFNLQSIRQGLTDSVKLLSGKMINEFVFHDPISILQLVL